MGYSTKGAMQALAVAAILLSGGAKAQETPGGTTPGAGSSSPSAGLINPFMEHHPTPEQIAENGGKTVVLHYMSRVDYTSVLSLVYQVQGYFRAGYRKFVIPMHTPGGVVDAAHYGYEMLSRMPIDITTVAVGPVDSAGVWLYCMGEKRYAAPGSSFLFHPIVGNLSHNRRSQEAAQRMIDTRTKWVDGVNEACFGGAPDSWDLERRDYRVPVEEAREVGLVNAGSDYFEDINSIGAIAYIPPTYYPPSSYKAQ